MPVDLYLGWALLWGELPILIMPRASIWMALGLFLALDLAMMPACAPVVELSRTWLQGEAIALVLVLLPAALFSRWTINNTQLGYRSLLWAITASSLLLFFVPEIFFALSKHGDWRTLMTTPGSIRNLHLQLIFLLAVPAFSAVQEFSRRGPGKPIHMIPHSAWSSGITATSHNCRSGEGVFYGVGFALGTVAANRRNSNLEFFELLRQIAQV